MIYFATGNREKVKEAQAILKIPIEIVEMEIDEVQGLDSVFVITKKAEEAFKILQKPVIVDDVSVFIEALNGFPGPLIKFLREGIGNQGIIEILSSKNNRRATVQNAIGFHDGKKVHVFLGEVTGTIATEEKGSDGWGFDTIFIPEGEEKTYAEMGFEKKNQLSHRRRSLDKLKEYLDSQKVRNEV